MASSSSSLRLPRALVVFFYAVLPLATHAATLGQWQPPRQTAAPAAEQGPRRPRVKSGPVPTTAPRGYLAGLRMPDLFRRDVQDTCGYINGNTDEALACPTGCECQFDAADYALGCCEATRAAHCTAVTACIEYSSYQDGSCSSMGPSTICCSETDTPYCTRIGFADPTGISLVQCVGTTGIDQVIYTTPTGVSSATTSSEPTSSPAPSTSPAPSISPAPSSSPASSTPAASSTSSESSSSADSTSASSSSADGGDIVPYNPTGYASAYSDPSTAPSSAPSSDPSSSRTPVGAIVGGTLGGLAALALIGAGLMASRALKRRNEPPLFSPVFPAEPAPPRQPPMPYFVINHSHAAAAAAGIGMARTRDPSPPPRDARASTAKHPHDSVYSSGSGIVSPVSVGYTRPISELPTPPSHNAQGVQFPFPFPQRQQQQQQHPPFHPAAVRQHAVELPSTKMADMFELPE